MAGRDYVVSVDMRPHIDALSELEDLITSIGVDALSSRLRCKIGRLAQEGWLRLEGPADAMKARPEPELLALLAEMRALAVQADGSL